MTTSQAPPRRLYRLPEQGVLGGLSGGVAAGIADHLGVPARYVRIGFVALAFGGGLGVALYGTYLIVLPVAPGAKPGRLPTWLGYAAAGVAVVAAVAIGARHLPVVGLAVPSLLACLGGALIWRQASEPDRVRLRTLGRSSLLGTTTQLGRVRILSGAALVVTGGVLVLARADVTAIRDGLLAMIVTMIGLALITGPWWLRVMSQLSSERAERIRSQERADIAARLHDSVLQTLALIQRNADSPREVARLARGQERELRTLLYESRVAAGMLSEQLRTTAGEVEDAYAMSVDVVVVGDLEVTDAMSALVAAAREALVNAAKHAAVTTVSLYAEVEEDAVTVFVKDRGSGFDQAAIGSDRQGLYGSIVGRVERHGGHARIDSAPGRGTEIELQMPR